MIRSLILDIDGVLVGDRHGFNFPDPHPDVVAALKTIRQKGIYVSLCTAKPAFAIEKIIRDAHLNNMHITDGGAVIIDPIDKQIAAEHGIPKELATKAVEHYQKEGIYQEFYTPADYYIREGTQCDLTQKHTLTLQRTPQPIKDVHTFLEHETLVKLFLIAKDEQQKESIAASFVHEFANELTLSWTLHPNTVPWQFGIVTAKGISKQKGAEEIAHNLHILFEDILGVGDTTHDWQFMQLCGYAAAMGNATDELKRLVRKRGNRGTVGPSVNENGVIEIFQQFKLL